MPGFLGESFFRAEPYPDLLGNTWGRVVRVLIVDDQPPVRRGIRALLLLGTDNIEVCGEAEDGHDAIAQAAELKPDVILMDVRMPVVNGFQATREIRRQHPDIQVIVLSHYDLPFAREHAVEAGAFDYVEKSNIWMKLLPALRRLQMRALDPDLYPKNNGDSDPLVQRNLPQMALRDAEQRFHSTFENSAVGMAHVAENGRWLRVNQKLCDIIGYSKSELEGLRFQDITYPSDLAADLAQASKVASGELDRYALDKRYIRKDGSVVPMHLNVDAVRDGDGNLRYYSCVLDDTAARTLVESTLKDLRRELQVTVAHLELLSRQIKAPLTRCSRDLRYLWVNQNYADWLNRPIDKIVGRPIKDVLGMEAFRKLHPRFDQVLTGNDVAYKDTLNYDKIGMRTISAAYRPTLDPAGSPDGWIAFVQDITDRKDKKVN